MAEIVYDGGSPGSTYSDNPGPLLGLTDNCELLVAIGDLILGATDEFGVKWTVPVFEGWDGSPSPTLALTQRARGHGATASESFLTARVMRVGGYIHSPDHATLLQARHRLNAAVTLTPFNMVVAHETEVLSARAQRQGENLITILTDKLASYSILIAAKDPRRFGELATYSTLLPFSSGGVIYPVTYPLTYTGVTGTGLITINNPGNTQAPVWLRIDGPIPAGGWSVTHLGKQQTLTFATALELGVGEFITVDMDRRQVLAQGQAPRSGYVTSRGWFSLDPGDNVIAFSSQNYSETATLTVITQPAWS